MEHSNELVMLYSKIEESILSQLNAQIDSSAQEIKSELSLENPLLPVDATFEKKKNEIISIFKKLNAGTSKFQDSLEIFSKNKDRYLTLSEIKQFDAEILEFTKKFLNSLPLQTIEISDESTIQSILGISEFILFCFYTVGYNLLTHKQFKEASDIFSFLSVLNPLVKDHWMGLGIAEQEQKNYEHALNAYAMASIIDFQDPKPHFLAVHCYMALKDFDNADAELSIAQKCIKNGDNPTQWEEYVKNIISELNRKKLSTS